MLENDQEDFDIFFGQISLPISSISRIVVPVAIAAYIILVVKIYSDNKGDLKTSHVFIINLIITFLLCMMEILIEAFIGVKKNQDDPCNRQFLSLLIRIFLNSDLLILQVDHFVSVWKPYLHLSISSPKLAVQIVLVSKVPSIIPSSVLLNIKKLYYIIVKTV